MSDVTRRGMLKAVVLAPVVVTLLRSQAHASGSWAGVGGQKRQDDGGVYSDWQTVKAEELGGPSIESKTPPYGTWLWRQQRLETKLRRQAEMKLYGGWEGDE